MKVLHLAALLLAACIALPAAAEWRWRDENGHLVVSDMPPPASIPKKNILKAPPGRNPADDLIEKKDASADGAAKDAGQDAAAKANAPKSMAEKELDFKKRQDDAAEAAKKDAENAAKAKAKTDACSGMRANLAGLETARRVVRYNDKGEQVFIDDKQRATEAAGLRKQIADKCTN